MKIWACDKVRGPKGKFWENKAVACRDSQTWTSSRHATEWKDQNTPADSAARVSRHQHPHAVATRDGYFSRFACQTILYAVDDHLNILSSFFFGFDEAPSAVEVKRRREATFWSIEAWRTLVWSTWSLPGCYSVLYSLFLVVFPVYILCNIVKYILFLFVNMFRG